MDVMTALTAATSRHSPEWAGRGHDDPLTADAPVGAQGKRSSMLDIERELAEKCPGSDNNEPYAGSKLGQPLSAKATAAKANAGVPGPMVDDGNPNVGGLQNDEEAKPGA